MTLRRNKITTILLAGILVFASSISVSAKSAKREFRGAWIQCVNGQFQGLSTAEMQKNLTQQLDVLKSQGANAIIFQVRPECDALYESELEPWSKFLTGVQGQAPSPYWDPLAWMVAECHKRNMEIHAWINPYRAKTKSSTPCASHIASKHPEWTFNYDGLILLNPAYKECRDYICLVVKDIVSRYDVDGLHIDDYFYPYPVAGKPIPDDAAYQYYAQRTVKPLSQKEWRVENVNRFIEQLSRTIKSVKPWVKFGVSPFGIYRNKTAAYPEGSDTRGTQNYDDLYADILKWVNEGWVDYNVPQLYWQIGHGVADYKTLIYWWNKYASNRPLYIGEDIERTVKYADTEKPSEDQMAAKYLLHDEMENVTGTVLWYSRLAVDNYGKYGERLKKEYWKVPVLQPLMPFIDGKAPEKVTRLKRIKVGGDRVLFWTAPEGEGWKDKAVKYIVYRFDKGENVNLDNTEKIAAVTTNPFYKLPAKSKTKKTYVVTALDRMNNESEGVKIKTK